MNKKQLKAEILKCGVDPEHFIRNYVKIEHPLRGLIPFTTFDYQSDLLKSYQNNRLNIVLKARQLGISEITASYATWLMMFRRNKNVVIVATKKETAANMIRKIRIALENLPKWIMLSQVKKDNVYSIELSNGSRVKAVSTAKDAGRSEAGSLLIIDEAAHIENMDQIWTGLRPVVKAGGSVAMLSTPNGVGNTFQKLYAGAEKEENEFAPSMLMWWLHPENVVDANGMHDLEDDPVRPGFKTSSWFRKETAGMTAREIAQEYECNFNASGDSFITAEYMKRIESEDLLPPISFEAFDRNLHIWSRPEPHKSYFVSADVARGDGKDNSAYHVWDAMSMDQVAEYYAKLPLDAYAQELCRVGKEYNGALLVIENNSVGLACLEHVKILEYENIYYSRRGNFKPGEAVDASIPLPLDTDLIPGFSTTPKTRPLMMAKLEEYIRLRNVTFRSQRFMNELRKFIWKGSRAEAMTGYNDDLVLAAAIGCWIRDTFLAPNFLTSDMTKRLLNMTTMQKTENINIPGASKDPRFVKRNETMGVFSGNRDPYKMSMPDGTTMDLGWLISKG